MKSLNEISEKEKQIQEALGTWPNKHRTVQCVFCGNDDTSTLTIRPIQRRKVFDKNGKFYTEIEYTCLSNQPCSSGMT